MVEQESGPVDGAVGVEVLGMFQVADGFIDAIVLLLQERRIEPGGVTRRRDV